MKIDEFVLFSNSFSILPSFLKALSQIMKCTICGKQRDLFIYSKTRENQTDIIG